MKQLAQGRAGWKCASTMPGALSATIPSRQKIQIQSVSTLVASTEVVSASSHINIVQCNVVDYLCSFSDNTNTITWEWPHFPGSAGLHRG